MNQPSTPRAAATLMASALTTVLVAAKQPAAEIPAQIIHQSLAMNEADWRAEPAYDHCERDDDGDTARTYDVTIIEGTPYKRLIAVDDRPISQDSARNERLKLERARVDRRRESASARRRRLEEYQRTHARILALFRELASAFTFTAGGRERVDSKEAYVLNAEPRPDYDSPTRDGRVLSGMKAVFWVDTRTYQWIRVRAVVTKPVSIVGFQLVRVEPGTTIVIEKAPVEAGIWLMKRLQIKSESKLLFFVPHHTFYDERDFDYRRTSVNVLSTCDGQQPHR
jgi:hypothetical protein